MSTTLQSRVESLTRRVTALERAGAPPAPRAIGRIAAAVARHFAISLAALMSESRAAPVSLARHVAWALARDLHGFSTGRLARVFDRDHTTIIAGVRRIDALRAADPAFAAQFDALAEALTPDQEGR